MSFKEKLRDEILPKAVGYFNSGMGMNESVVKAAQDYSLNMDQVDRLVETMNTARTIAHYEKNAEDRTGSFDVADKSAVKRMLYSSGTEKSASVRHDTAGLFDYSSYDVPERDMRRRRPSSASGLFEKAAEENASDDTVKALTDRQKVDALAKKASDLSRIARGIEDGIGMLRDSMETMVCKIASSLCRGDGAEDRYAAFQLSCRNVAPDVARSVAGRVPRQFAKSAEEAIRRASENNVVDDSAVSGELEMADEVAKISVKVASASAMVGKIRSFEEKARGMMSKLAQSPWFGSGGSSDDGGGDGHGRGNGGGNGGRRTGGNGGNVGNGGNGGSGGSGRGKKDAGGKGDGYADSIVRYFTFGKLDDSVIDDLVGRSDHETGIQDYVDNIRRSAILEDLVANDPILSEASPKDVANAFRTLVQTSPSLSLNKEVSRAILRQVVNSVAVSPFDAKQWADYESTYTKTNKARAV